MRSSPFRCASLAPRTLVGGLVGGPVGALVALTGALLALTALTGPIVAAPAPTESPGAGLPARLHAPLGPDPLQPAATADVALLDRALAKLATHRRLLVVGAHPDDEDTSALTLVSREQGGESAYLSLSRGEGGQNLIGPELGIDLGLVRSRELLAARGVDGGRQYFTRAYDFGYTRSLDETFAKWPREVLLEDAVRVIRRFRPQVIVSVFPGNPRAGHGQHQAAGVIAHEAFEAAGEPAAMPELPDGDLPDGDLPDGPWAPSSIFQATWWDRESTTLTTDLALVDPLAGRTTFQIAMESRSQHRSQDMGRVLPLGPYRGRYAWVAGPGGPESNELFAGIDTRLEAIAGLVPEGARRQRVAAELAAARELAEAAREGLAPRRLGAVAGELVAIRGHLRRAMELVEGVEAGAEAGGRWRPGEHGRPAEAGRFDPDLRSAWALLSEKLGVADRALAVASGVALDAWTDRDAVAPGERFRVEAVVFHGSLPGSGGADPATGGSGVEVLGVELASPEGRPDGGWWFQGVPVFGPGDEADGAEGGDEPDEGELEGAELVPGVLAAGTIARWAFDVAATDHAPPSRPYFLEAEDPLIPARSGSVDPDPAGRGTLYDWSAAPPALRGEPFGPPPLVARFHVRLGGEESGEELTLEREVVQRVSDQAVGEVRRPLRVVPRLEVSVEPELVVWSTANGGGAAKSSGEAGHRLAVTLRSNVSEPLTGRVRLETPPGWPEAEPVAFSISRPHGTAPFELIELVELPVEPPAGLERGHSRLGVVAELDGPAEAGPGTGAETFRTAFPLVDYPHIRPTPSPHPARVELAAAPIRLPELKRVGYVLGASDRVPDALAAIGLPVETLSGRALGGRDLSDFDAIVVGSRAYETDAELARNNGALLDYARAGGLVIVLYQQYQFVRGEYAPYPLDIDRPHDRVTDETAPVRLLEPEHPVFTTPNRIGPEDWEGWVQERGLYFAHTWDARYRPLLQLPSDPALSRPPEEAAGAADATEGLRGGLLVAELGEGTYVYTGLALFRQLPAGVTGAYRLFANLLGLADRPGGLAGAQTGAEQGAESSGGPGGS